MEERFFIVKIGFKHLYLYSKKSPNNKEQTLYEYFTNSEVIYKPIYSETYYVDDEDRYSPIYTMGLIFENQLLFSSRSINRNNVQNCDNLNLPSTINTFKIEEITIEEFYQLVKDYLDNKENMKNEYYNFIKSQLKHQNLLSENKEKQKTKSKEYIYNLLFPNRKETN